MLGIEGTIIAGLDNITPGKFILQNQGSGRLISNLRDRSQANFAIGDEKQATSIISLAVKILFKKLSNKKMAKIFGISLTSLISQVVTSPVPI